MSIKKKNLRRKKNATRRPRIEHLDQRKLFAADVGFASSDAPIELNSIHGTVYVDNNTNGLYDDGDTPLGDVRIELTGTDAEGNAINESIATNLDGNYTFRDLPAGTYTVSQPEQPIGLVDSNETTGRFKSELFPNANNGVVGNDEISEIVLTSGDHGIDYDFGEQLVFESPRRFDVVTRIVGDWRDDSFQFIAGDEVHQIIHNGEITELDASETHQVLFVGRGGQNSISVTGTEFAETARLRSDSADFLSTRFRVTAMHTSQATANSGGGIDRVFMYDTPGDEVLRGTQNYVRMDGEGFTNVAYGFQRMFGYATQGGDDQAVLTDSSIDDTFKASAIAARMYGRDYYNMTRGFDRVIAKAIYGGEDTAYFWDSAQSRDVFQSTSRYARMYNQGYYNYGSGFENVIAYANQGGNSDRAYFQDSAGDDVFVSTALETGISNDTYTHKARGFERMHATASEGNDQARLYDSPLNDIYRATPENSTFYNSNYYLKINNFDQVDAYSSAGGSDRAYFTDSDGNDTFISLEGESRMFGDGFDNASHGFARTYAFPTAGGEDRVLLYDSNDRDSLLQTDGLTRMFGEGYWTRLPFVEGVDVVHTDLNDMDRALMFGRVSDATVDRAGSLGSYIRSYSSRSLIDNDDLADLLASDKVEDGSYMAPTNDESAVDIALRLF